MPARWFPHRWHASTRPVYMALEPMRDGAEDPDLRNADEEAFGVVGGGKPHVYETISRAKLGSFHSSGVEPSKVLVAQFDPRYLPLVEGGDVRAHLHQISELLRAHALVDAEFAEIETGRWGELAMELEKLEAGNRTRPATTLPSLVDLKDHHPDGVEGYQLHATPRLSAVLETISSENGAYRRAHTALNHRDFRVAGASHVAILTLAQLTAHTRKQLLERPRMGPGALLLIEGALAKFGLELKAAPPRKPTRRQEFDLSHPRRRRRVATGK